jgi:hypothetical protein
MPDILEIVDLVEKKVKGARKVVIPGLPTWSTWRARPSSIGSSWIFWPAGRLSRNLTRRKMRDIYESAYVSFNNGFS